MLFSFLLRGPAAEWYESIITNATTWENVRRNFITRFSDGRNKFRYRMQVEHCIRGDEEIRNFLHRIKRTVGKGWPNGLNGIEAAHHAKNVQLKDDNEDRYIDYSLKGLRPRYLQRKAQEYLMENPNATWNDFSSRITLRDVSFQVCSNFLNDEEQTTAQMATLGQEMRNLRSELLEHRVNAVEGNSRTKDPNQKGRQKATRFCNYCRTNGHTPSWCRKKIRDEELKKKSRMKEPPRKELRLFRITTKNEDQTMDRNNGLENRISKEETTTIITTDLEVPPILTTISLQDQTPHMGLTAQTMEDHLINAQISHPKETMEIDLEMDLLTTRMGTGETMEIFLVPHRLKEETSHKITPIANQEVINLTILRSTDLTIDQRLALRPMNKNFRRTMIRHHLMSVSPQPMIPLTNYRIFAR